MSIQARDVSQLLRELREGRREAQHALLPLIYEELRAIADRQFTSGMSPTLSPTVLVHEAYLKLFDRTALGWKDRRHFFSVAAIAMRQIVVDHARRKRAGKRGGDLRRVELDSVVLPVDEQSSEIVAVDEALSQLQAIDERLARVVELRYFGGLSLEETAEVLEIDERTVTRDWRKARALLYRHLTGSREG